MPAIIRAAILIFNIRSRAIPYCVRSEISDSEHPCTVYYERIRTVEGIILCVVGLYLISKLYADPIYTFNGSFIWYLVFGFVFLALGLPLCFICSGGCTAITSKRILIYRTRCFLPRTLTSVPSEDIERACRISAGKMGSVRAFFSMIFAFIKGEKEKTKDMCDAAFLSGYLEVRTALKTYRIRLITKQADYALSDIAQLCRSEAKGGQKSAKRYSVLTPIICAVAVLTAVIILGITLTSNARNIAKKQYVNAVYLQDTGAYSQAYKEFEHLAERYDYRDSDFRADYCYARLEMSQGNYKRAAERISALEDFEEKNEMLYICASGLADGESAAAAAEIFSQLGDYANSTDSLRQIEDVYNMSIDAYEKGDLLTAAEGFSLLRDYKQTGEYVTLIAEEADKLVPNRGNPENLEGDEILRRCNEALPILSLLSWDKKCSELKSLCEEYISVYTFE